MTCVPTDPIPSTLTGDRHGPCTASGRCPFEDHLAYCTPGRCAHGCHAVNRYVVRQGSEPPAVPACGFSEAQSKHMVMRMHAAERALQARTRELDELIAQVDRAFGPAATFKEAMHLLKQRKRRRLDEPSSPSLTEGTQSEHLSSEGST